MSGGRKSFPPPVPQSQSKSQKNWYIQSSCYLWKDQLGSEGAWLQSRVGQFPGGGQQSPRITIDFQTTVLFCGGGVPLCPRLPHRCRPEFKTCPQNHRWQKDVANLGGVWPHFAPLWLQAWQGYNRIGKYAEKDNQNNQKKGYTVSIFSFIKIKRQYDRVL